MTIGVVDIGSNSVRLLVVDGGRVLAREANVTGLASGVDALGVLSDESVARTTKVLRRYAELTESHGGRVAAAVATSAARDAANGIEVMHDLGATLGTVPQIISGEHEAHLSFAGATSDLPPGRHVVVDIGGGSTEVVEGSEGVTWAASYDIGSVRLTDRVLPDRPAHARQRAAAEAEVDRVLSDPVMRIDATSIVGVAGTFTSLGAMHLDLDSYDPDLVHGAVVARSDLDRLVDHLAGLTVPETAAIPSLEPARAPVILAGAIVAARVMDAIGASEVMVSERDLLDGLAASVVA